MASQRGRRSNCHGFHLIVMVHLKRYSLVGVVAVVVCVVSLCFHRLFQRFHLFVCLSHSLFVCLFVVQQLPAVGKLIVCCYHLPF